MEGFHVGFCKASHQPEGDLLKHIIGICNIFDHGHSGVAERHDHRAGKNQDQRMGIHGFSADQIRCRNSCNTSQKGSQLDETVGRSA